MPHGPRSYAGYVIRLKPTPATMYVNRNCGTCRAVTRWTDDVCDVCGKAPAQTPSA